MFPYLVLLRVGFALPLMLPPARCALTAPFHPYQPKLAVYFLWHFPWVHTLQALPGTLPCGARTFLWRLLASDCLANSGAIIQERLTIRPTMHSGGVQENAVEWKSIEPLQPKARSENKGNQNEMVYSFRIISVHQ